jgi:hypothetical protein
MGHETVGAEVKKFVDQHEDNVNAGAMRTHDGRNNPADVWQSP